jgi:hypothetical protein
MATAEHLKKQSLNGCNACIIEGIVLVKQKQNKNTKG